MKAASTTTTRLPRLLKRPRLNHNHNHNRTHCRCLTDDSWLNPKRNASSNPMASASASTSASATRDHLVATERYQETLLQDSNLREIYALDEGVSEASAGTWQYRLTNGFGRVFEESGFPTQSLALRAYEDSQRRQISADLQQGLQHQLGLNAPINVGNPVDLPAKTLESASTLWTTCTEEEKILSTRLAALAHITLAPMRKERLYAKLMHFTRRPNLTVNACFGMQRQLLWSILGFDAPFLFPPLSQHLDNISFAKEPVQKEMAMEMETEMELEKESLAGHPYAKLSEADIYKRYLFAPKPWKPPATPTQYDWNPAFFHKVSLQSGEDISLESIRMNTRAVERETLDRFIANWGQVCTGDATSTFDDETAFVQEKEQSDSIVDVLQRETALLDVQPLKQDILRVHASSGSARDFLRDVLQSSPTALSFRKSSEKYVYRGAELNGCYLVQSQWSQHLSLLQREERKRHYEGVLHGAMANTNGVDMFFDALDDTRDLSPLSRQMFWEILVGFNRAADRGKLNFHALVVIARRIAMIMHSSPETLNHLISVMPWASFDQFIHLGITQLRIQSTATTLIPEELHPVADTEPTALSSILLQPLTGGRSNPENETGWPSLGWSKADGSRTRAVEAARETYYPVNLIGGMGSLNTESHALRSAKLAFGAAGNAAKLDELHLSVVPESESSAAEACRYLATECTRKELGMMAQVLNKYWGSARLGYTVRQGRAHEMAVTGLKEEDMDQNDVVDELLQIFGRRRGANVIPEIIANIHMITPEKFMALGLHLPVDEESMQEASQQFGRASKWKFKFVGDPLGEEVAAADVERTVFLKNIPIAVDEKRLLEIMSSYGDVASVQIHTEHVNDTTDTQTANERLLHALKEVEVKQKSQWTVVDVAEDAWVKSHDQAKADQESLQIRMDRIENHAKLMTRRGRRLRFWIEQNWYQLNEPTNPSGNSDNDALAERTNEELRDLLGALVDETEDWCTRTSSFVTEADSIRMHAMKRWENFQKLFSSNSSEPPLWDEAFARASELEDWTHLFTHLVNTTPEKMDAELSKFKTAAHLHASALHLCTLSLERIHAQTTMLAKVTEELERRQQLLTDDMEAEQAPWVELHPISHSLETIPKIQDVEDSLQEADDEVSARQRAPRTKDQMEKSQRKLLKAFKGWFDTVQSKSPGSSLDKLLGLNDSKSVKAMLPKLQPTEGPYAFVTFSSADATKALLSPAVQAYGMVLSYPEVKLATSKSKKEWKTPRKDWNHHKVDVASASDCKTLWVADLPLYIDQAEATAILQDKMASHGLIGSVSIDPSSQNAVHAFNGIVRLSFESHAQALQAFQLFSDFEVYSTKLRVSWKSGLRSKGR